MKNDTRNLVILFKALCLSMFLVVYGCNNEEFTSNPSNPHGSTFSAFQQNPYDFVGKYHNEGLLYVLEGLKKSNVETRGVQVQPSIEEIQRLASQFYQENKLVAKGVHYCIDTINYPITKTLTAIPQTRTINENYSDKIEYYLSLFLENLRSPKGINSLEEFNQRIGILEEEVCQSRLTEEEKAIILVAYAVGKYSLKFWLDVSDTKTLPVLKTRSESFSDWWAHNVTPAIKAVVESDFAGAAAGALDGAISGATGGTVLAPGPGTVTGAVAGAVTGGASGAIYGSVIGGAMYYFSI